MLPKHYGRVFHFVDCPYDENDNSRGFWTVFFLEDKYVDMGYGDDRFAQGHDDSLYYPRDNTSPTCFQNADDPEGKDKTLYWILTGRYPEVSL